MGQVDPESVSARDVTGGDPTTVAVKFEGYMGAYEQIPVTYEGDTDALAPNPPDRCPWPASAQSLNETSFQVGTVAVDSPKTVTVIVHGPTKARQDSFVVSP